VHLDKAVAALLFFVSLSSWRCKRRFTVAGWPGVEISANVSLMIILGVLAVGVIASLLLPEKERMKLMKPAS
jgi:tellurite resistance protein TerC